MRRVTLALSGPPNLRPELDHRYLIFLLFRQPITSPKLYLGDSIIRRTFSTWHVEKQNILESLKFLYKYFIRVLRVQKK